MRMVYIALLLLLLGISCKKALMEDKYATLAYEQTYCSDPWTNGPNDTITVNNVVHYFDSVGLYVAGASISIVNPAQVCQACSCKTGKVIYVSTFANLKDQFAQYNFH